MAHGNNVANSKELRVDEFVDNLFSLTGQEEQDKTLEQELSDKRHQDIFDQHMAGKAVQQGTLTESQVSTTLAFTIASNAKINGEIAAKRKQTTDDILLLEEINRSLAAMESGLEDQHGQYFALDMLADMVEAGKMPQEDYDRFAAIEDPVERRQAIAAYVQAKLDSGEWTMDDLKKHPWAQKWLNLHEEQTAAIKAEAEQGVKGEKPVEKLCTDANSEATALTDKAKDAEKFTEVVQADTDNRANEVQDVPGSKVNDFTF